MKRKEVCPYNHNLFSTLKLYIVLRKWWNLFMNIAAYKHHLPVREHVSWHSSAGLYGMFLGSCVELALKKSLDCSVGPTTKNAFGLKLGGYRIKKIP